MTRIHIDVESRSPYDLTIGGHYNYARHPLTQLLMLSYRIDHGKVQYFEWCSDTAKREITDLYPEFKDALLDPHVLKYAWHAGFERDMIHTQFGIWIPYEQWRDPMIYARYISLPGALEDFQKNLGLPMDKAKMADGKRLVKLFSIPIKERKKRKAKNEGTLFDVSPIVDAPQAPRYNNWQTHPAEWAQFGAYNRQDVVAEADAAEFCEKYFPLPERTLNEWFLDQKINDRGMPADEKFAENSVALAVQAKNLAKGEASRLSGLPNPNSRDKMLAWCKARGYPFKSLRKEPVSIFMKTEKMDPTLRAVLALRPEFAKTSYTKLNKLLASISPDKRVRNQFSFLGSPRAGRWTSTPVQLHNMAKPVKELESEKAQDKVRAAIYANDFAAVKSIYPGVITAVTSCIRSAFVAPEGNVLAVSDENAIETRVAAWVSECETLQEVFRRGDCPYINIGVSIHEKPESIYQEAYKRIEAGTATSEDLALGVKKVRTDGKPGMLGCVYRLSGGELFENRYGDLVKGGLWGYAENMGVNLEREMCHKIVGIFRGKYREIVRMWYKLEDAVVAVLKHGGVKELGPNGCIKIGRKTRRGKHPVLWIELPSGRRLHYIDCHLEMRTRKGKDRETGEPTTYEKEAIVYKGIDQVTKQWRDIDTHGGKLFENIVQAIARDVLAGGMTLADKMGLFIIGHVHDEAITERKNDPLDPGLGTLNWCLSQTPPEMPGFIIAAKGYEGTYYRKD